MRRPGPAPIEPARSSWPVYRLRASSPLPQIDCSTTLKLVIFSERNVARYNYFVWRFKIAINLSLVVGITITWLFPFLGHYASKVISIIGFSLLVVPLTAGFLPMRYDIVRLLLRTYEFWYIAINSALSTTLLVFYLPDARALLCVITYPCYLYTAMVDARYSGLRTVAVTLGGGALSVGVTAVAVAFESLPQSVDIVLFRGKACTLHARDVILNSLGIVGLLLVRNAVRRFTVGSSRGNCRVRMLSYRTRIGYVEDTPRSAHSMELVRTTAAATVAAGQLQNSQFSQLCYVPPIEHIDSAHVLWRPSLRILTRWGSPRVLQVAVSIVVVLNIVIVFVHGANEWLMLMQYVLMALSMAYCGLSCACQNRSMLRLLLRSFDAVFLFVNFCAAGITTSYVMQWGPEATTLVVTSWCWAYWLITIDALTPNIRAMLGVSRSMIIIALVYLLVVQVAVCIELVFQVAYTTQDRVILSLAVTSQYRVVIMAIPFLFTRIFSVFWWTWRLLWRVCTQGVHDLIVIQGATEYDDYQLQRRIEKRRQAAGTTASVAQVWPAAPVR